MSSDPSMTIYDTTIAGLFDSLRVQNYISVAASVFVFFEHLITTDREIDLFWKPKASGASVLFLTNRYLILVESALSVVTFFDKSVTGEVCNGIQRAYAVVDISTIIPQAMFSAMRALALTKSRAFTTLVFILSLGPVAVNVADFALGLSGYVDPMFGCLLQTDNPSEKVYIGCVYNKLSRSALPELTNYSGLVAARGSVIAADALVIAATWRGLFPQASAKKAFFLRRHVTLTEVFLRDGTIYFVSLLILNVLDLIFSLISIFPDDGNTGGGSNITFFNSPLTAVLISRFLINLQETNLRSIKVDSDDPAYISSHSGNTLPSFVATPGPARVPVQSSPQRMQGEALRGREGGRTDNWECDTFDAETPSLDVDSRAVRAY